MWCTKKIQQETISPEVTREECKRPEKWRTPILFLVFNRPDTTGQVFESIRKAKPPRLYVAADGPRENVEGEAEKVDLTRQIATNVDWPCEVKTLFRKHNLGCRFAPQRAIDWFFTHEREGIILEDDCLPHPDFFIFCEWALNNYRDDRRVRHINGNNFAAPKKRFRGQPYAFSALAQVWGWATWADRWRHYQGNPFYLERVTHKNSVNWSLSACERLAKLGHLAALKKGLDAWDYQWQITILNSGGLALSPATNLISNLGDGPDATHTSKDNRVRLCTESFAIPDQTLPVTENRAVTHWYAAKMGLHRLRPSAKYLIGTIKRRVKATFYDLASRILYSKQIPIVIASSGRSGSTMLFEAVSSSLIQHKYGPLAKIPPIKKLLCKFTKAFLDRLQDLSTSDQPILKTHALYTPDHGQQARFIFVYGDPLESAQSVAQVVEKKGHIWLDWHLFHLESQGYLDELYTKDILNYERQISTWAGAQHEDVLVCDYEEVWNLVDSISTFIGFPLLLPERRERSVKPKPQKIDEELFKHLREVARCASRNGKIGGREVPEVPGAPYTIPD